MYIFSVVHFKNPLIIMIRFSSLLCFMFLGFVSKSQLPDKCLVGYWQNWSPLKLSEIHPNYNVVQLAFATTKTGTDYDMEFNLPSAYTKQKFIEDLDLLHSQNKKIILSIGGANDPVILDDLTKKQKFIQSINQILADYNYKIDGIDLDLESSSLNFGSWTMSAPAQGQLNIIDAVKSIMNTYKLQTGKKLLLTMAPENVYIQGALSDWQVNNINGGAYLPIIEGLKEELDLLHPQYYNAGGASGGTFANDGKIYYDTGNPDYITAITETLINGFTLKANKGKFSGIDASKVAIGLPSNNCNAAGTGYVDLADLCLAVKYLKGEIAKPASFGYMLNKSYPSLRGVMTWSINEDKETCNGEWSFALNFPCMFSAPTGLESSSDASAISMYPNPVSDIVYLSESTEWVINSIQGTYVSGGIGDSIDVSKLVAGVYLLSLDGVVKRFVKD